MAIQNHVLYSNFVLADEYKSILSTKLQVRSFMTIDNNLVENPGMIKKINKYTYAGGIEKLGRTAKNTDGKRGKVTVATEQYTVAVNQQVFDYTDEDVMTDPNVVSVGLKGMAEVTANDFTDAFFGQATGSAVTLSQQYPKAGLDYDSIVDAIAKMNLEDESGLFLLIDPATKAEVRKDPDFKGARLGEILFNGQIGTIAGIPVVVSKKAKSPILATKEAITLFIKKENKTNLNDSPWDSNYGIEDWVYGLYKLKDKLGDYFLDNLFGFSAKWNFIDKTSRINNLGKTAYGFYTTFNGMLFNSSKDARKFIRENKLKTPNDKAVHPKSLRELFDIYEECEKRYQYTKEIFDVLGK